MEPGYDTMTALQHAEALVSKLQNNSELHSASELKTLEDVLLSAILSVRRMVNSLNPINQVPPEVLGVILSLVPSNLPRDYAGQKAPFYWPSTSIQSRQDIVRSTHVCHHWRKTLLATPMLWASISSGDYQSATMIPAFIERSRPAHLQLFVDTDDIGRTLQRVFDEQPSHIRELHLSSYNNMYLPVHSHYTLIETCRLPQLECLTLALKYGNPFSLPVCTRMLFNNELPRLRTLTLANLPWFPSNRFDHLTHLSIINDPGYKYLRWEIADLFSFLRPCHRLEEIVLSGFASKHRHELYWRPLKFRRLRRLAVGNMSAILLAWFITHILNPTGLTVRVFGMSCGVSDDFTLGGAASIRVPRRVRLTMQRALLVFTAVDASTGIRVERKMCLKGCREEDCSDWAENLWTLWNLRSVEELWLNEHAGLMRYKGYEAFGSKLLGELASVTTLVLSASKAAPVVFGDWLACLTTPCDDDSE
ncbi:hypothetical protein B0H21DRAFT_83479, partial [Amylocystis lapponica]